MAWNPADSSEESAAAAQYCWAPLQWAGQPLPWAAQAVPGFQAQAPITWPAGPPGAAALPPGAVLVAVPATSLAGPEQSAFAWVADSVWAQADSVWASAGSVWTGLHESYGAWAEEEEQQHPQQLSPVWQAAPAAASLLQERAEAAAVSERGSTKGATATASCASTPEQTPRAKAASSRRALNVPLRPGLVSADEEAAAAAAAATDAAWGEAGAECARLMRQLEGSEEEQAAALEELRGQVWRLSLEAVGCRVVQLALKVADQSQRRTLVAELHGHVLEALESPHGNYVVQQLIELMPTPLVSFVAEELAGSGSRAARHRYGCRIVCRLLEHAAQRESTAALVDELLLEAGELARHVFAHHVVQACLEHGLARQRRQVLAALRQELPRNARNRNASYVMETALSHCCAEDRSALVRDLRNSCGGVVNLAQSQFGRHVVRALLRLPLEESRAALQEVLASAELLGSTKHGKRLLEELPRLCNGADLRALANLASTARGAAEGG